MHANIETLREVFSAGELAAMAGAVPSELARDSRRQIADNSHEAIDVSINLQGVVTKLATTPESSVLVDPVVELLSPAIVCDLLHRLGVTPVKLRRMLRSLGRRAEKSGHVAITDDCVVERADLLAEFARVTDELIERLPSTRDVRPGRAGAVTSTVQIERL